MRWQLSGICNHLNLFVQSIIAACIQYLHYSTAILKPKLQTKREPPRALRLRANPLPHSRQCLPGLLPNSSAVLKPKLHGKTRASACFAPCSETSPTRSARHPRTHAIIRAKNITKMQNTHGGILDPFVLSLTIILFNSS